MQQQTIGFIGGGNMAKAIISGILSSGITDASHIIASSRTEKTADALHTQFQIETTTDNHKVAAASNILFLAVKPNLYEPVIKEIRDDVRPDTILVSIAAGQTIRRITSLFGREIRLIRTMPNTPASVGEGMTALTPNEQVTDEDLSAVLSIFNSCGKTEIIPESLMDCVTGVSGSSPAYAYLFIEAMADAAVADGMPRAQAYTFAAQAVLGAAKMVLETGEHPGALKDAVCSPAGTTIEAVAALEEGGLRSCVIRAQRKCVARSREMNREN
jgi:pyrroline-5-carboxylate reductase